MPHQRSDWAHPTATSAPGLACPAGWCSLARRSTSACVGRRSFVRSSRSYASPASECSVGTNRRARARLRPRPRPRPPAPTPAPTPACAHARLRPRPCPHASNKRSGVGAPARKQHAQTRPRHARAEPLCVGQTGRGLGARVVRAGADGSVIVGGVIKSNMVVILTSINANLPPLSLHDLEARPAGERPSWPCSARSERQRRPPHQRCASACAAAAAPGRAVRDTLRCGM